MALQKKKFGNKSLQREIQFVVSLAVLIGLLIVGIYLGINGSKINFDFRKDAAGKTYFVENSSGLQDAINKATDSDAIFLKVGTYTTSNPEGFEIKNKKIQILGAGRDFVTVQASNNSYVFNVTNSNVRFDGIKIKGANKNGVNIQNEGKHEVVFKNVGFENNSGAAIRTDSKTTVSTSAFTANGSGIVSSGDLYVDNTLIETSSAEGITIEKESKGNARIVNSILQSNKGKGILLEGGKNHIIKNVTVYKNEGGIVETGSTATSISNSIIQGSKTEGVSLKGSGSTITYSNSYGNGTDFSPSELKTAEGNLSIDSQFTSETDVHLTRTSSPVRGKGITSEKNNDGTRIDLGAFGGNPNLSASNGAPTITSSPPKYLHPGQTFTYQIKATDPDNDPLTYTIVNSNAPKWITQDKNSFTGTPSTSHIGFWAVVVVVSDLKGHNVVHPISINVIPSDRALPQDNPTPTTAPTSAPAQKPVAQITFSNPKAGTVMTQDSNEIKWSVTNGVSIDKYVLKYSIDKEEYKTITTLPGDATSYKWTDIEKLTPGKYILQLEATDKSTPPVTIKQLSEEFEVKSVQQNTNSTNIVITKNSPADNDNVTTRRPLIVVEFKPDADLDGSKTYLKVNDQNVEYKFTKNTIYFDPQADLQGTKARIEVKIVTKDGGEATKQWIFNLPIVANPQDTELQITNTSTVLGLPRPIGLLILGIIILGLLLLILYFVAKLLKTIRDERQGNLEAEFTEYYEGDNPQTAKEVSTTETAVYPVILDGEQQPDAAQANIHNEYMAQPDVTNEYYVDQTQQPMQTTETTETTTTTMEYAQPATTEQEQQYQPQEQSYTQEANYVENVDQNQAPAVTASETEVQTYQQPEQPQQEQNQQAYDASVAYAATNDQVTSQTDDQGNVQNQFVDQNDAANQNVQADSTAMQASADPQSTTNEYISELKKKYGISDDDIDSYNAQNDEDLPDPSHASTRPKKA